MLRGRYGWLSQRNQFILPTFLTRTTPPHPSSPVEGKKRLGRRIRAHREREREREKREGAKRKRDTERNIGRKRGWSAIARRLIWFNGEFIWVDAPPFNQQDCLRPPTGVGPRVPLKIIPVKTCLSPFREREREREREERSAFATFSPAIVPSLSSARGETEMGCGWWLASSRNRGDGYYRWLILGERAFLSPFRFRFLCFNGVDWERVLLFLYFSISRIFKENFLDLFERNEFKERFEEYFFEIVFVVPLCFDCFVCWILWYSFLNGLWLFSMMNLKRNIQY